METYPTSGELIERQAAEIDRLRAALRDIENGTIIQGMSPGLFASKVLNEQ